MIIGRLTRDPELRTTPNGASVTRLGLATNYVYTNQQTNQKVEQVEYHNVVLWRKLAEIANQYLKKGARVYIEGRLQTRNWEAKDGTKRTSTEIVCDNMIMLDSRGASSGTAPMASQSSPVSASRSDIVDAPPVEEELPTIQTNNDVNVEDIPF